MEKIEQIIEDFNFFDNWEDKYEYLVDIGRNLPSLDEEMKKDEYKLKGCQSTVIFFNKRKLKWNIKICCR